MRSLTSRPVTAEGRPAQTAAGRHRQHALTCKAAQNDPSVRPANQDSLIGSPIQNDGYRVSRVRLAPRSDRMLMRCAGRSATTAFAAESETGTCLGRFGMASS